MRSWRGILFFLILLVPLVSVHAIDPSITACAAQLSILDTEQAREIFAGKSDRVIEQELNRVRALRKILEKGGLYSPSIAKADTYLATLEDIAASRNPAPRAFLLDEGLLDDPRFVLDGGFVLGEAKLGVSKLGPGTRVAKQPSEPTEPELDDTDYVAAQGPTNSSLLKLGVDPKVGDLSAFLTPAKAKRPPAPEYFDPTIDKLPAGLERIFQFALVDTLLGPRLLENIESMGKTPDTIAEREKLMVMVQEPEIRALLEVEAYNILYKRSERTKEFIRENPNTVWDWVNYGAGLHDQNANNYFRLNAPDIISLTIEKTPKVAPNFAQGGSSFTLNSGSREPDRSSLRQRFGEGDLNFLGGGAVQVHQFDNSSNPPASSFAVSILLNRALSKNAIIFEEAASDFELESIINGEPIFASLTASGYYIRTRGGAGAGLGIEALPPIPGLREAYLEAKAEVAGTGKLPTISVYGDLFQFASTTERPLTEVSEQDVAVIGAKDSGNAVVRVFIRSNALPAKAFGRDSASVRGPKRIFWLNQKCTTCELFLSENRSFYYDIAKGYRNGQIIPIEFKLTGFKKLPNGRYRLTDSSGKTRTVRYVVFTVGFDSLAPQYFAPLLGDRKPEGRANDFANDPSLFRDVIGYEPTLGSSPSKPAAVTLARQFILPDGSPSRLLLWGPKAGNIVSEPEKKQIGENSVASANHVWRVWNTVEAVVEDLRANNPSGLKGDPAAIAPPPVDSPRLSRSRKTDVGVVVDVPMPTKPQSSKPGDSILFPARLLGALDGLDLTQTRRVTMVLTRTDDGRIRLRLEPALEAYQMDELAKQIASDETLVRLIQNSLSGTTRTLRAEFVSDPDGKILGQECEILRSKMVDPVILQGLAERAADSSAVTADIVTRVRATLFDSRGRFIEQYAAPSGYSRLATEQFEGDMPRTYTALVAVFGSPAELRRQMGLGYQFTGTVKQHDSLRSLIGTVDRRNRDTEVERMNSLNDSDGYASDGLVAASAFFEDSPSRAYDAAVQIYGAAFVEKLGWFRFSGKLNQLVELRKLVNADISRIQFNDRPSSSYIRDSQAFGPRGLSKAAKIFAGSLDAAYEAAVETYGEKYTTETLRWYRFTGTVEQHDAIRNKINAQRDYRSPVDFNERPSESYLPSSEAYGPTGYVALANLLQLDMGATYDLVVQIYGAALVTEQLKWRRFSGSADQYSQLRTLVNKLRSYSDVKFDSRPSDSYATSSSAYAAEGLATAIAIFADDFARTFDAAVEIYGKEFVVDALKWYRVSDADKTEHFRLRRFINELKSYSARPFNERPNDSYLTSSKAYGQQGYFETAERIFGGQLARTYDTAVEIYGRAFVDALQWQRIPALGPVAVDVDNQIKPAELIPAMVTTLRKRIYSNPASTKPNLISSVVGIEGVTRYAMQHSGGDIGLAVREMAQNLGTDTVAALKWPNLNITVKQVEQIQNLLPSTAFWGSKNGYAKAYRNGDGLLAAARAIFGGDVGLTKQAVEAVLGSQALEDLGWN